MEEDFDAQRRSSLKLLDSLENGGLDASDAAYIAEQLDPVLFYSIVTFLRRVYPASDPAATGVLERVVAMSGSNPALVEHYRQGEEDPIVEWFEHDYEYRDFKGRGPEIVDMLIDKLAT